MSKIPKTHTYYIAAKYLFILVLVLYRYLIIIDVWMNIFQNMNDLHMVIYNYVSVLDV